MTEQKKLYHAGAEIYGYYIAHKNGTVSTKENGKFFETVAEADYYAGIGDEILPKFVENNKKRLTGKEIAKLLDDCFSGIDTLKYHKRWENGDNKKKECRLGSRKF